MIVTFKLSKIGKYFIEILLIFQPTTLSAIYLYEYVLLLSILYL